MTIYDKPYTPTVRDFVECETEGDRSPAQVAGPPPTDAELRELERLAATDKLAKMRRVKEYAPQWPEITRKHYANAFEILSLQFASAADYLRRPRVQPDDYEFLNEQQESA